MEGIEAWSTFLYLEVYLVEKSGPFLLLRVSVVVARGREENMIKD